jgi:hypothetical protein
MSQKEFQRVMPKAEMKFNRMIQSAVALGDASRKRTLFVVMRKGEEHMISCRR